MSDDSEWLARLEAEFQAGGARGRTSSSTASISAISCCAIRSCWTAWKSDAAPAAAAQEAAQEAMPDSAALRSYFRRQMFRIQSDSLLARPPIFETLERTSDLADERDRGGLPHRARGSARRRPIRSYAPARPDDGDRAGPAGHARVRPGFGRRPGLRDSRRRTPRSRSSGPRVAERMINAISAYTGDGVIFTVDTRLRPNGREGALVQTEGAYQGLLRQSRRGLGRHRLHEVARRGRKHGARHGLPARTAGDRLAALRAERPLAQRTGADARAAGERAGRRAIR